MKTLVWPDTHNKVDRLKKVIGNFGEVDKRIFLGDYFDSYDDTPADARKTAIALRELMEDPKNVFIEGNHDTPYIFNNQASNCPGWSPEKHRAVRDILSYDHLRKLQLFEFHQGFLLSHAGINERTFQHPVHGITLDGIAADCQKAKDALWCNTIHPVYYDGYVDGRISLGGITWLRWHRFEPIPGWNQIVGHTQVAKPEIKYARKKVSVYNGVTTEKIENVGVTWDHYQEYTPRKDKLCSINYNLDTGNAYFATIEDGEVKIHLTLDYL